MNTPLACLSLNHGGTKRKEKIVTSFSSKVHETPKVVAFLLFFFLGDDKRFWLLGPTEHIYMVRERESMTKHYPFGFV